MFEREQEEAAVEYDISPYTARDYQRLYKAAPACTERLLAKTVTILLVVMAVLMVTLFLPVL